MYPTKDVCCAFLENNRDERNGTRERMTARIQKMHYYHHYYGVNFTVPHTLVLDGGPLGQRREKITHQVDWWTGYNLLLKACS